MSSYKPVIGIEIHVELNTKTKMFCRCSADYFGKQPNTHTCPVCLGLPGATPYTNEEALKKCLMIGLALNCSVNEDSKFERKNYFYPDLPKGYQISQYRWPLCVEGFVQVGDKKIRINRVHQEEDTGKLTHLSGGTAIDFNRSGVPLVEIVTEPDFETSDQVVEYAKKLQLLFKTLGVSNADMEKGDMRLEANVSVRQEDRGQGTEDRAEFKLPNYRVELKNINSFRFMKAAIEYEIKRQIEALETGETLTQETRGWDETKKQTYLQRSKEEAHDYRYFPDPDLGDIRLNKEALKIQESLPELPWEGEQRLVGLGLSQADARYLVENLQLLEYFEEAVELGSIHEISPKEIANVVINKKVDTNSVSPDQLVRDLESKKSSVVSDEAVIEQYCQEAIKENPKAVEDYKAGKLNVIMVLVGAVMKKSQGQAEAGKVKQILEKLLS